MPPETPRRIRAMPGSVPTKLWAFLELGAVVVRQKSLRDLLHRHREVVLGAGLHERRRIVVEGALAELVVIVVDLPGTLGRDDDERIARVNMGEQIVDGGIDHGRDMVPAGARRPPNSLLSSSGVRARSCFSTM